MAATLAFFSATRFWIRALKEILLRRTGFRADNYHLLVFCLLLLLAVNPATVERTEVTGALQTDGSDQSLDFGSGQGENFSPEKKQGDYTDALV